MKYCTYCGKQLADNETCTCRQETVGKEIEQTTQGAAGQEKEQTAQETQSNSAEQVVKEAQSNSVEQKAQEAQSNSVEQTAQETQSNNGPQWQSYNGQSQQYSAPQGQPYNAQGNQRLNDFAQQINSASEQLKKDESVAEIIDLYKGLIKTPVDAISKFVKNASIKTGLVFIIFFAIVKLALTVVGVFSAFIDSIGSYAYRISFIDFIGSIFSNVVVGVVDVLVIGVVIMLILNTLQKEKKVSFAKALTVACLYDAAYLPIRFIANVVGVIPFSFFDRINSWGITFASTVGFVYLFFGIRNIEDDDNNMPLVYGAAFVASAICTTIINLVF